MKGAVAVSSRHCLMMILLSVSSPTSAQSVAATQTNVSQVDNSTVTESPLTAAELERSRVWGLSDSEWRRYQSLLLGIRGSVSPANLSPIEVLGLHARDEVERRRYAELWARAMFDDAERILAFQRAYDSAVRRLSPNLTLINTGSFRRDVVERSELSSGDRVLFFTGLDCPACDAVFGKLLTRLDRIDGIDVYVAGVPATDDALIRGWAGKQEIDADWVRSGRVTLNHDAGTLSRIAEDPTDVPALFVRRSGDIRPISYAAL